MSINEYSQKYSAIIEIIGIKEDAEFDPAYFLTITEGFRLQIESTLKINVISKIEGSDNFTVHIFRDYCYIECNSLENLIFFLKELRRKFFIASKALFRSVVTIGALNIGNSTNLSFKSINNKVSASISHLGFGEIPSRLYGIMERFKGVGILIDDLIIEKSMSSDKTDPNTKDETQGENQESQAVTLRKILKEYTFQNFYVSTIGNKFISPKFQIYRDVIIEDRDDLHDRAKDILDVVITTRYSLSKKLARFYIPTLVNLARHLSLASADIEKIDNFIGTSYMTKCKDIAGIELVYLTLLNRLYGEEKLAINDNERVRRLEKEISKVTWIAELLRNDSTYSGIPKEIITNSARRSALKKITELNNIIK